MLLTLVAITSAHLVYSDDKRELAKMDRLAQQCGLPNANIVKSEKQAHAYVVSEYHKNGGLPGQPLPADIKPLLARQQQIENALPCLQKRAAKAGMTITYPITIYVM